MQAVETRMFKKGTERQVKADLDAKIGTDFELTYSDETGDYSVTVFDVETTIEYNEILEIEKKYGAY